MRPFAKGDNHWFSIPAHRPFLDDLARGLYAAITPDGAEALSDAVILVPNRRAARALSHSFVAAAGGKALLLPQIRALGDLDEGEPPFEPGDLALDLPPAISPWRRRFELARLAGTYAPRLGRELDAAAALELGDALGAFFDSLEIEEVADRERIETLVEGDLAEHWQVSAGFLSLVVREWPKRLETLGLLDVTARRVELLKRLARKYRENPPPGPVVAAGSTGSAPATAQLLIAIAGLDKGCVVLPGLDEGLAEDAWAEVDEQHPQKSLQRLLAQAGITRDDVRPWLPAADTAGRWRRRVVNEALRPAQATDDWRDQIARLRAEAASEGVDPIAAGLAGLSAVTAATEEEAAAVAAVLLREALETDGKTAALITPDQALARRVSARLARWDIDADSSAGSPLADCPTGVLISLVIRAVVDPTDPVTTLAILKHPFTRLGRDPAALAKARDALEAKGLRGARPRDFDVLLGKVNEDAAALAISLKAALDIAAAPFADGPVSPAVAARALVVALEALCLAPDGDQGELWGGSGGETAATLLAALIEEGEPLAAVTSNQFARLIERLLAGETVRIGGATHRRVQILGALEGRLIGADVLILAGLEEGVWPPNAPTDPFLSRPMRTSLSLPAPERRIGLSAHDFAQAACAPEVVLLHTERRAGQPSVKSRWLWRLETLARGADLALPARPEVLTWARALDRPEKVAPAPRPDPRPPVEHRPRQLYVTRIENLTRDPYAVWARDILQLRPLDRPDEAIDARARGTAIHAAFEAFAMRWPKALPADAADQFEALYLSELAAAGLPRAALAREQALAKEAAAWVADLEARRRAGGATIEVEKTGTYSFDLPGGPFTIKAKTDRIEVTPSGFGHILDYKTGKAPSKKMVESGFSPQLTLTAGILAHGTFDGLPKLIPGELTYIEVTGRKPAGREEVRAAAHEGAEKAELALIGLYKLLNRYDKPGTPYLSRTAPQFVKAYAGDYDHLARVFEWSTSGDDEAGE